ncbi:helix-turn-helix domain-containing protein [Roseateles sp. DC23W]|uniref:Helix-turn-helix domain-containing protein n=1 Tax=Pelomonas dachongensis TaxID=3299029 RepID=A0ABW7ENI7_9BURK
MRSITSVTRTLDVACLAYDQWSLFEAGIAQEVFGIERPEFVVQPYRFRVIQGEPGVLRAKGRLRLQADAGLRALGTADLIVVPGWRDHGEMPPAPLLTALRRSHQRGARLLSLCTGTFVLAAAGVLDGRRATTHWRFAEAFRARFPNVELQPDVLYVDEGDVISSAGSAAGIDACLHVVRKDHGAEVANLLARTMVTAPHRDASQAQFVDAPVARQPHGAMSPLMDWIRRHLHQPLRVSELAGRAAMSERNFLRHFTAQVGMGPKQWLRHERVRLAQGLLEGGDQSLAVVAERSGFGTVSALRAAFIDVVGVPPSSHRRQFRERAVARS